MNIALWIVQVLLAGLFGFSGWIKVSSHAAMMVKMLPLPIMLIRFIGVSELAGAIGMILPGITRIRPVFTPLAATGLATIMVLATCYHVSRGEISHAASTVGIGAAAVFVAWGRFRKVPIKSR